MRSVKHSMMRRRRWLPAAFCLLCCLLFSGCTPGATVDSLLKPPSLSKEQQQIYLALQDAVGSGITLQYPRAGANLSAFTVVDLDNDLTYMRKQTVLICLLQVLLVPENPKLLSPI